MTSEKLGNAKDLTSWCIFNAKRYVPTVILEDWSAENRASLILRSISSARRFWRTYPNAPSLIQPQI